MRQFHIDLLLHFQIELANLKHKCLTSNSWSFVPYGCPEASSFDSVHDHEQIEQRQIKHRRLQELFSGEPRPRLSSVIGEVVKANAENHRRREIQSSGMCNKGREK